jgi:hypothetical protein
VSKYNLLVRATKAANALFDKGIPYWTSLECYAHGWVAGYLAAQRKARSAAQRSDSEAL